MAATQDNVQISVSANKKTNMEGRPTDPDALTIPIGSSLRPIRPYHALLKLSPREFETLLDQVDPAVDVKNALDLPSYCEVGICFLRGIEKVAGKTQLTLQQDPEKAHAILTRYLKGYEKLLSSNGDEEDLLLKPSSIALLAMYEYYSKYAYKARSGSTEPSEADLKQAGEWCLKAVDDKYPSTSREVGILKLFGRGVERDPAAAFRYLHTAAAYGDTFASAQFVDPNNPSRDSLRFKDFGLGISAWEKALTNKDKKALFEFERSQLSQERKTSSDSGNLSTSGVASTIPSNENSDTKDRREKTEVISYAELMAAEWGDDEDWYQMGLKYKEINVTRLAYCYFKRAAEANHVHAQYEYGLLLLDSGLSHNVLPALTELKKAAENNHREAQYKLGLYVINNDLTEHFGRGTELTKSYALNFLRRAAEAGHPEAQYELGGYSHRVGDKKETIEWLKKASANGNSKAQDRLDEYYECAASVSVKESYDYFKEELEKLETDMKGGQDRPKVNRLSVLKFRVGKALVEGVGVPQDFSTGVRYVEESQPEYPDANSYLMNLYLGNNPLVKDKVDLDKALYYCNRILEQVDYYSDPIDYCSKHYKMGLIYLKRNEPKRAREHFEEAEKVPNNSKIYPEGASVLHNLGDYYYKELEYHKAQKLYRRAKDCGSKKSDESLARVARDIKLWGSLKGKEISSSSDHDNKAQGEVKNFPELYAVLESFLDIKSDKDVVKINLKDWKVKKNDLPDQLKDSTIITLKKSDFLVGLIRSNLGSIKSNRKLPVALVKALCLESEEYKEKLKNQEKDNKDTVFNQLMVLEREYDSRSFSFLQMGKVSEVKILFENLKALLKTSQDTIAAGDYQPIKREKLLKAEITRHHERNQRIEHALIRNLESFSTSIRTLNHIESIFRKEYQRIVVEVQVALLSNDVRRAVEILKELQILINQYKSNIAVIDNLKATLEIDCKLMGDQVTEQGNHRPKNGDAKSLADQIAKPRTVNEKRTQAILDKKQKALERAYAAAEALVEKQEKQEEERREQKKLWEQNRERLKQELFQKQQEQKKLKNAKVLELKDEKDKAKPQERHVPKALSQAISLEGPPIPVVKVKDFEDEFSHFVKIVDECSQEQKDAKENVEQHKMKSAALHGSLARLLEMIKNIKGVENCFINPRLARRLRNYLFHGSQATLFNSKESAASFKNLVDFCRDIIKYAKGYDPSACTTAQVTMRNIRSKIKSPLLETLTQAFNNLPFEQLYLETKLLAEDLKVIEDRHPSLKTKTKDKSIPRHVKEARRYIKACIHANATELQIRINQMHNLRDNLPALQGETADVRIKNTNPATIKAARQLIKEHLKKHAKVAKPYRHEPGKNVRTPNVTPSSKDVNAAAVAAAKPKASESSSSGSDSDPDTGISKGAKAAVGVRTATAADLKYLGDAKTKGDQPKPSVAATGKANPLLFSMNGNSERMSATAPANATPTATPMAMAISNPAPKNSTTNTMPTPTLKLNY